MIGENFGMPLKTLTVWSPVRPHLLPRWWHEGDNRDVAPCCGACGVQIAFYCDPIREWRCWTCIEKLIEQRKGKP